MLIILVFVLAGCEVIATRQYHIKSQFQLKQEDESIQLYYKVNEVITDIEKQCQRYAHTQSNQSRYGNVYGPYYNDRGSGVVVFVAQQIVVVDLFVWNPGFMLSSKNRRFIKLLSQELRREFPHQFREITESEERLNW